jgi:hypothetical protein
MRGTIVWHGDRGTGKAPHTGRSTIKGVTDKAALLTLAAALAVYTTCNRGRASVNDFDGGTPSAPGVDANVDERAELYFYWEEEDSVVSLTIPSWDTATYPLDPASEGDRIVAADVNAIAALMATATGRTYSGLWGKHIKKT